MTDPNQILNNSMLDAAMSAVEGAHWLTEADESTVALLLRLAERLDHPDFPVIDDRFDNVSESLFLKTSAALGLTPEMRAAWEKKEKKAGGGKLETLRKGASGLRAV